MQLLDLTLPTPRRTWLWTKPCWKKRKPAQRLVETLRFWEPPRPLVVVGRGSRVESEVDAEQCMDSTYPSCTAPVADAIVTAPGCLYVRGDSQL